VSGYKPSPFDPRHPHQLGGSLGAGSGAAVGAHAAEADPHTGYQRESEKGVASGYASLGADGLVPQEQLGTGTQDGTRFLRDDGTWQPVATNLDGLSDVVVSSPATAQRLRYDGSVWRNSSLIWQPLTDGNAAAPELVFDAGDVIMVEA